jgi:CTP-dependent riboflavin kinase
MPKYKVGQTVYMIIESSSQRKCPTCKSRLYGKGVDSKVQQFIIMSRSVVEGIGEGVYYSSDSTWLHNMPEEFLYATKKEAQAKIKSKK